MWLLILLIVVVCFIFYIKEVRLKIISGPAMVYFKRALPQLSQTEREAMEAGDTWWDASLFSGKPNWSHWLQTGKPALSDRERDFIEHELAELMAMLDESQICAAGDLPPDVWQFLKEKGFFSFIIPEKFGGKAFSAQANSAIVAQIATRSLSTAVTVMVPNSLGPAELLLHFGTTQQQQSWLPRLADGSVLPCFALTSLEAGSDAGGITDFAVVCKQEFNGEMTLGLKVSWQKRYITLAPVATVLGLAFKVYDPDHLLSEQSELGITCALIPTDHEGVKVGPRHDPMGLAFMNGTTEGQGVFIPLDWVIGEQEGIGKGWRMLVACLSAGRGISLPALSAGTAQLSARATTAYCSVRRQFKQPLCRFEGVQSVLARIAGLSYSIEATRQNTALAIDLNKSPAVITAIAKYHLTEMARISVNDAMDLHGGKAIQRGPLNYLALHYQGMPISITVEGANILTRNLMIFGQGATRCHPYVLKEMAAVQEQDAEIALYQFDKVLTDHLAHSCKTFLKASFNGLTLGFFSSAPVGGEVARYYKTLTWYSQILAIQSDLAMLVLGGKLKLQEMRSARLGDMLSHLYLGSCALKKFEDDGRQCSDLPLLHYAMHYHLSAFEQAHKGFVDNFAPDGLKTIAKRWFMPFGRGFSGPSDKLIIELCDSLYRNKLTLARVSSLCSTSGHAGLEALEQAFKLFPKCEQGLHKFERWQKAHQTNLLALSTDEQLAMAVAECVLDEEERERLADWFHCSRLALSVDDAA
ncbi:acyl-CoA dehydrogenase [Pseudoalteromonas rubra]|uniref:Acyl-coenzyme A dehydrogenase n=1 Tax=Pseudoalteromonas rubra TaxID=43658 RepID=A0A5S3WLU8_9GAMM|nr:acyl-CoA dehydrogenase [Pseudoalteromonas rubra]TMP27857.1 acyl-CoA dehydrogenase [Pseudoalteromonas rubra]TMP31182.1 acyl-CoA dehydrogenase [Pseudoalteromonas rubra]